MTRLSELTDAIRRAQVDGQWYRIDALVQELPARPGATDVSSLLMTLVDDVEHEAEVFGVVHAAEAADDVTYVHGLMQALPSLVVTSPRWARTLLARVLNSETAIDALTKSFDSVSQAERDALGTACEAVEQWRPERFPERVAQIRRALLPASGSG